MEKNKYGVSLAELLAVVVIMGIIAAIAVPLVGQLIEDTKKDEVLGDAISIVKAAELYCLTNENEKLCQSGNNVIVYLTYSDNGAIDNAPGFENYLSQDLIYQINTSSVTGFENSGIQYKFARITRSADGSFKVALANDEYSYGEAYIGQSTTSRLNGMHNPLTSDVEVLELP